MHITRHPGLPGADTCADTVCPLHCHLDPLSLMMFPPCCGPCPLPVNYLLAVPSPLTAPTYTPGPEHQLRWMAAGGSIEWGPEDPLGGLGPGQQPEAVIGHLALPDLALTPPSTLSSQRGLPLLEDRGLARLGDPQKHSALKKGARLPSLS
jgi:hypothetical protein